MQNQQNKKGAMQRRLKTNVLRSLIKYEEYIRTGIPQIVKEERIETPIDLPEEFDMDCDLPETAMKLHELNCLSVIADTLTELVELCKEESCDISD